MPFFPRFLVVPCLLLCQACSHPGPRADAPVPVSAHEFHFDDGGKARYFVLDKRPPREGHAAMPAPPVNYLFVIPGSDCTSMQGVLPHYFDGLEGTAGAARIFILHKRFITSRSAAHCDTAFTRADHPSRWLADQGDFIRAELAAAKANGQQPARVVIVGISEGAELAPLLAQRVPDTTHLALLANGGMDPFDAYRLQMHRHGLRHALEDIARQCAGDSDEIEAAERTCRYWRELQDIRHADNLLALVIPVFMAMGEADDMVPIESAWFIRDRFAAQGKTNLHLVTVPGADHRFRRDGENALPQIWAAFERWLQK